MRSPYLDLAEPRDWSRPIPWSHPRRARARLGWALAGARVLSAVLIAAAMAIFGGVLP